MGTLAPALCIGRAAALDTVETAIVPLTLVPIEGGQLINRVGVTREDRADAFVNLGLIRFLRYDVVVAVERGLGGFAPCR